MKFKELIEKYIDGDRKKEWELMVEGYMPLTPSILKDFEIFIPEAYHVTDFYGVKNIMKLQGKRKDIATFTKGSEGISRGAISDGDVLFTLEGYSSFQSSRDFESVLDRNGHRWLNPLKDKDLIVNNNFSVPMKSAIIKEYNLKDRFGISALVENMNAKEKAQFIKFYFDEAKKLTTKSLLKKIKDSIAKSYTGYYDNNEILLHNFKVKSIKLILDTDFEDDDYKEEARNNFADYSNEEVDGYITRLEIERINEG